MSIKTASIPPKATPPEVLRSPAALSAGGASVLEAGGMPELVSEPVTGETSLLEAGVEAVPEAAGPVRALVIRVEEPEPVTGLTSVLEVMVGGAPLPVELAGMAPVSTAVEEAEVKETTVVVLVLAETSDALDGTTIMEGECELSVPRLEREVGYEEGIGLGRVGASEVGYEEGGGLGSVEAWEKVACAAHSTESAFHDSVEAVAADTGASDNKDSAFREFEEV